MKNSRLLTHACNSLGLGKSAAVPALSGDSQLLDHGAIRWFRTGKLFLVLTGMLVSSVSFSPSLHAAIIFNAGDWTVGQNGNVSVPITVSSDLGSSGSVYWGNVQFDLVWSSSVLSLQTTTPVDFTGSPLAAYGPAWGSSTAGGSTSVRLTWFSPLPGGQGVLVPDNSTLFTVNFTAIGGLGSSTLLSFANIDPIALVDQTGGNLILTDPTGPNGQVTVVPEPINWALGLLACVFIGTGTVRWISRLSPIGMGRPRNA